MYGYIYITYNIVNKKMYIGQKSSSVFLGNKYLGSGTLICRAIAKYGKENFSVRLIEECNSQEELDERERYWIKLYDAVNSNRFYNLQIGGTTGNRKGSKLSYYTKTKISKSLVGNTNAKGFIANSETRRKMSESMKGNTNAKGCNHMMNDKWRKSISESLIGNPNIIGENNGMSVSLYYDGKKFGSSSLLSDYIFEKDGIRIPCRTLRSLALKNVSKNNSKYSKYVGKIKKGD